METLVNFDRFFNYENNQKIIINDDIKLLDTVFATIQFQLVSEVVLEASKRNIRNCLLNFRKLF